FVSAALQRSEFAASFIFDENLGAYIARSAGLGIDVQKHIAAGHLSVLQVDPAELSPGEFAWRVQMSVEKDNAKIVVIDSLNGYFQAMPDEHYLMLQLHELLTFLNQRGVLTLIIAVQEGTLGLSMRAPLEFSYLADNVLLLRYFEAIGRVRKALSVIKKRTGAHAATIRELTLSSAGTH